MSIALEDSPTDGPRPSLPGIHSLFSKEDAQPATVPFPGTLSGHSAGANPAVSGRPGSRGQGSGTADMFETFSLSSESGSSRMGSLSSIASKGSPTTHQVGPPAVPPPGWHANRASFTAQGIDPLASNSQGSMSVERRGSDAAGASLSGGAALSSFVIGGGGGPGVGHGPPLPSARNGSVSSPSALNSHQPSSSSDLAQRAGSTQTTPQHNQHYPAYGPSLSSSVTALDASFVDGPPSSIHRHSSSFSGPSSRMQPSASSSTAVMRPPSPLRPYSAGNGYGPMGGGFVRGEGGGGGGPPPVGRGQELVFYDDQDPQLDPSRQQTFQGGPVRRGSEVSSQSGSRRGSMVDPRSGGGGGGAGPDRSSTFVGHPSAHPYHPYQPPANGNHHIQQQQQQQHFQPTPMSAGGQPLFHPHQTFAPVGQQPSGVQQSLPFPQQPPFPANPSYAPNYANQQTPFYLPNQPHPHQQQQQYVQQQQQQQQRHPRLQQPLLHSVPTQPAPHLLQHTNGSTHPHHTTHSTDWQRRNSLPSSSHHTQRMQMMPPPPPPPVWQREGAHQQHVFAGTPPGGPAAGTATEAMRRASDGDLLTGPSGGKESKYDCPYCGKKFNRPSSLKIHTYSHTGEKPFSCNHPQCGRKFSVQSNLKRHSRTHSTASATNSHISSDPSRPSSSTSSGGAGAGGGGGAQGGFDPDVDAEGEEDEL